MCAECSCSGLSFVERLNTRHDVLQDNPECRMALPLTWGIMIAHFFGYSILAVYLSAVLPDASGVRDPPYFFLLPSYWRPRMYKSTTINTAQLPAPAVRQVDEDVAAEADKMRARLQANGGHISRAGPAATEGSAHNGSSLPAIEVYGLQRHFGRGSNEFWAVCDSWFEIPKQQLFCLLGPNGAGVSKLCARKYVWHRTSGLSSCLPKMPQLRCL